MIHHDAPICAAIDIGSNTIHIVVAKCAADNLDILVDEEELVRIGQSVTATGEISPQKRDDALATLKRYKALAEKYEANPILVVATEAIRQAKNSHEFCAVIREVIGFEVVLIEGHVEAALTFYGATYELSRESGLPSLVGVMDLGGGSTELVVAKHCQLSWLTSVPIGSGGIHDRYMHANPPNYEDMSVARTFLHTYFHAIHIKHCPSALIATGGTANALLHLAQHAFHLETKQKCLTYDDLLRCEGLMHALSAEEIAERYHVSAGRAQILPAGVLIVRTVMERLQLKEISISSHGIREGALLAYAQYGKQWLEHVKQSAQMHAQSNITASAASDEEEETFAQAGQHMLQERFHKMVVWREEVLKHEDIEVVHKMRVASRRLRAVLDAYQSISHAKPFKKVYRQVKAIADMLGKARDTDVMIENLRLHMEHMASDEQAGTQWLIDRLRVYRQQHQQKLETFLKQLDLPALERQIELCLSEEEGHNGKS